MTRLAPLLVLLAACRAKPEYQIQEIPLTTELVFSLAQGQARAGEAVPYTLVLARSDGSEVVPDPLSITSDADPGLGWDLAAVTPHLAGPQRLTATVDFEGAPLSASAPLTVDAGVAWSVDLELSDYQTRAGAPLSWTLAAWDAFGNEVDTEGLLPDLDSADVLVDDTTLSTTVPGLYTATVSIDGAWDEERFAVDAGEPVRIDLTLSDTALELNDTTTARVRIEDSWDNEVPAPWTLSTDGPDPVAIAWTNLTFTHEGWYTVTATVDGTTLSDSEGPLLIDSTGPALEIDSPTRADWIDGDQSTITGSVHEPWSGLASLTVDGLPVSPDTSGDFSLAGSWDFGMNVLESVAVDGDGNRTTDTRALLSGAWQPYGELLEDGLLARLHEGEGGLGTLEVLAEDLVSANDLNGLIPRYQMESRETDCVDLGWFGTYCWDFVVYGVDLLISNPRMGATDLRLNPRGDGLLEASFTVYDIAMDWDATATVLEADFSGDGDIEVEALDVVLLLDLWVDTDHNLRVDVMNTSVQTTNFDFYMDSWLYDVLEFFGDPVDEWVASALEDTVAGMVEDEVPVMVEDALQGLALATTLDLSDNAYTFRAAPSDVQVDEVGVTLTLATAFTADTWRSPYGGPGSLYAGWHQPTWTGAPGMVLGVGDDFLNQALFAFWGGGLLDYTLTDAELSLDVADLQLLFPSLDALEVRAEATLPPVVVPGTGAELLDLQVGDYHLFLSDPTDGDVVLEAYVSMVMGMEVSAGTGGALQATLGEPTLWYDVVLPANNSLGASDTEALLQAIVPLLLPTLTDALTEVPMPAIAGFELRSIAVGAGGDEGGYLTLGGALVAL
ncbi:MAG: hypothetical protein JXX28_03810 [Deltaproteobacteria bacterium]|nr:hypothetical protein [Deltaproteobacteria bacterium]